MTEMDSIEESPRSGPALRAIAMPADTNPRGDIFGGWLLSEMDLAGSW
jgi:acyl-CoA thioesterase YciA